jgi:adenosylcobinamide-phosphate synthase
MGVAGGLSRLVVNAWRRGAGRGRVGAWRADGRPVGAGGGALGRSRLVALAGAVALDLAAGEAPSGVHPVAGIGAALAWGHERLRGSGRRAQLAGGAATVGGLALAAALVGRRLEQRLPAPLLAVAVKQTFSLRQLTREGRRVAAALDGGELDLARVRLRALVSRPTEVLGEPLLAAAAIESLAENLGDSVVAPLACYAAAGLGGAAAYRVVNTADAMYGYRGELEWLGKPAALADDALNRLPSRAAALALVLAALVVDGPAAARRALATWRSDAGRTASPNAGRPMAAMAGALGRRLEKAGHYVLGADFPEPAPADVRRAARLVEAAAGLACLAAAGLLAARGAGPTRREPAALLAPSGAGPTGLAAARLPVARSSAAGALAAALRAASR